MLKKEKGITLIALIITIIVMLILVGVTINVALNGGLFEKAEIATKETEEKAILEEMISIMEITDDGKINAQAIKDKMEEKYTVEGSLPNVTITGKLGKYNYVVSEKEIKIGEEDKGDLEQYYLTYLQGASGIIDISQFTQEEIDKYETDIAKLEEKGLIYLFENENYRYCSIDGYVYKGTEEAVVSVSKGSEEYQKVNSLIEESKSLEEELNELLIEMEYIYTGEAALSQYIKDNLSVKERTVNVAEQAGRSDISITSNVDEEFILSYGATRDSNGTRYLSIENKNNDPKFF